MTSTETTPEPLTDERIRQIKSRAEQLCTRGEHVTDTLRWQLGAHDVPALAAEIARLRAALVDAEEQRDASNAIIDELQGDADNWWDAPTDGAPVRVWTGYDDDYGIPAFLDLSDAKAYAQLQEDARYPEYADGKPVVWVERAARTENTGYPDMWDMADGNHVVHGLRIYPDLASALADCPVMDANDQPVPAAQPPGRGEAADTQDAAEQAPRGFRAGDLVTITGREDKPELTGRTGYVYEIDDGPQYPIGLTVKDWGELVWCDSSEIRHATAEDKAEYAQATGSGDAESEAGR